MCGITFALSEAPLPVELFSSLCNACNPRGPDYQNTHSIKVGKYTLQFHAAVLHLRGDHVAKQPFVNGDILVYNGEIWDGLDLSPEENDGEELFRRFQENGPLSVLPKVDGPYAFVFYQSTTKTIYWSRDPLGRRSLLQANPSPDRFLLSSVAPEDQDITWDEVNTAAVQSLEINEHFISRSHKREYLSHSSEFTQVYPFDPILNSLPHHLDLLAKDTNGLPVPTQAFMDAKKAFQEQLEASIRARVMDIPRSKGPPHPKARVAVLFSGGLDCTVLALLADKFLPEGEAIDLLNVAFENPRSLANKAKTHSQSGQTIDHVIDTYATPDRMTGLQSAAELATLRPSRTWNFVNVNVPYAETTSARKHITSLMVPNNTIMDLSIAQALYFAAKGTGVIGAHPCSQEYQSEARVLLSGLGADEQLGGYSRHKKAFATGKSEDIASSSSWKALIEELQMDLDRIGSRNLGRDDRVISTLGKEVRYPYLAGHVVAFLASLPVHLKVDYHFGDGIGDKLLLRAIARDLGLNACAGYPKRAIQFGARSAKMEQASRSVKGNDVL